ncbi:MAG TPA: rhomboid family intramembrane serine protease [Streptosporangiaceae bacterium]|nr:rhomboid family intramembrane serine protease [Streptosporangiaceae bacterium]
MSDPAASPVPTCFRHPGRETYVSCVRCGRHACPDCLRSAAVGQQCVECIRGSNRGARQARTAFGGRVVTGAVVTWALVAINIVMFLVVLARPSIQYDLGMLALAQNGNGALVGVGAGQWYRLITSAFVAPGGLGGLGFMDILFNMWALIIVGPALERMLGSARYLAVYLLSAIGGAVLLYYLAPPNELALGASGAVFGLFGAWFVVSRRLRLDSRGIVGLIVINLVLGFVVPRIAWQDHIGGLITGAVITAAYAYAPRSRRFLVQGGATVAVLALLAIAIIARNGQLGVTGF